MAVSDAGPDTYPQTVRVYFNLTPYGAIALMESLTRELNQIRIPFTFKVLYNPSDYGRYDSGVLYFEKSNYEAIWQVLRSVYPEKRCLRRASLRDATRTPTHFRTEVPLFTKLLAPGLALAEEPDCKFAAVESFGMNRCQSRIDIYTPLDQ